MTPDDQDAAIHHTAWLNLEAAIASQIEAANLEGLDEGEEIGVARGRQDAEEERDYEAANVSPMAEAMQHRCREAGLRAQVRDAGTEEDDVCLVMSEMDAMALLDVVRHQPAT